MDITRLRDETPGCAIVNHLNNAGSSLPTRRTLDATLDHLRLEAEIGGYEAADQAQERIEAFYPSAARLIRMSRDVNDGKASTDDYFVMKNLCAKIDALVAAKNA